MLIYINLVVQESHSLKPFSMQTPWQHFALFCPRMIYANQTVNDVLLGITEAGLSHYLNRRYGWSILLSPFLLTVLVDVERGTFVLKNYFHHIGLSQFGLLAQSLDQVYHALFLWDV